MKRFSFLLLVSLLSTLPASSQTHFITAGQTQGMIVTDYVPDYQVLITHSYSPPPQNSFSSSGSQSFDLDKVGVPDINYLYSDGGSGHCGYNRLESFSCAPSVYIACVLDSEHGYTGCDNSMSWIAKKYMPGDTTIDINDNRWQTGNVLIYSQNGGCYTCIRSGAMTYTHDSSYYFIKMVNATDTVLGYLHFVISGMIYDYAIEGQDTTIVISSTNDLTASNISISPNPFTNQININIDKPFAYQITDYIGRVVLQGKTENSINTGALAAGNYLLVIKNEETYSVKKIVKAKN